MNSWHAQQLKYALGIGGYMSFYGMVGLLVWVGGSQLGLPVNQRIMVIVVLLLTMPVTLLIGWVVTRRSKKKEEAAKAEAEAKQPDQAADGAAPPNLSAPTGTYADLPQGAEEVVNFLKQSNLGENGNGKEAVYSLPWYLIAGTPKAGKSSLVLGSNLNFQTLPSQRQSEQKMIRPTRGVDWRVTSDAVFVDTAGRYQTEGTDGDEWNSLLETIKKYRANRPIDGLLLVADTGRILNADEREIEEMAKVLRTRLDEAMQRLRVRFPVYLVFTHADAIEGFRDSFSSSKKEGETLVWGSTIPLEKSENAHTLFDEEFSLLHNSVMKRRLMRLSAPFPPVRQLRIFNFPLHFGTARRKLGAFVNALFRPNPFSENPFLRGFYFTAVPVSSRAQAVAGDKTMGAAPPPMVGASYFTQKFFRDVVLRDKDLVKTFLDQRQKPPIFSWLLLIFGSALTFILLLLAGVSLYNNKKLLEDAAVKGTAVINNAKADGNRSPLTKSPQEATAEMDAIEDLRLLMTRLDEYERDGAPIYMGMGLYSGNTIYLGNDQSKGLLNIYYNAIGRRFIDPTIRRVEDDLRKFTASQPVANAKQLTTEEEDRLGKHYDLLKAYLMLTEKHRERAVDTDIVNALKDYWFAESKLPENLKDDAENQLKFYAKQVTRDGFPRIQADGNLVAEARKKLQVFPPEQRYYKRKVTEISKDVEARQGAMTVDAILQRGGGELGFMEGSATVPGAYTLEGFKAMDKAIQQARLELSGSDWGMEDKTNVVADVAQAVESPETAKIRDRYFRDYADQWRNFVRAVRVKPYRKENEKDASKVSAKEALSAFSSSNSPMKVLLKEVEKNTNLSAKPKPVGIWETIKSWFTTQTLPDTGGTTQVEREFQPLFIFVEDKGEKGKAVPVDQYRTYIEAVSTRYNTFSDNEINQLATVQEDEKRKMFPQLSGALGDIDKQTKTFKDQPFLVDLLKQPVTNLSALLNADSIKQLGEKWASEVLPLARAAEQGYPFDPGTEAPADFAKLKDYLSPNPDNGKLQKFYDENLKRYFNGNPGQLQLKDANNAPFTQDFVDYLNKAFTLQQALFGKNPDVKFNYNFELTNAQETFVEMKIDGTDISSEKPSSPISFPATTGGGNGVIVKVLPSAGATSTGGANTSANTSAAPVNTSGATNSATNASRAATSSNAAATTSGGDNEKQFLGPWGLFKFFDASSAQKQSDNSYLLNFSLGGKPIRAKITPSGIDPFNKEIYKLRAPDKILK